MIKVSVIVPVYNVEAFLPRCLDSIVGQTLREIEIICVDDQSPDRSIDILNAYAAKDERIRIIRQENRGLGGARNAGFEAAEGEYILYVDSDDWIDADYCEKLYNAAAAAGADVACASLRKERPSYDKWILRVEESLTLDDAQAKFAACFCPPNFCVVNKLMRRSLLDGMNLRFREKVCYEDVEYIMRVIAESGTMVTVPDITYHYMVNGSGITKSAQTPKKQADKYNAHKAFVAYMDSHGLALARRHRNLTRRIYSLGRLPLVKVKECDGRRSYLLFSLLPVWWCKVKNK